MTGVPLTEEETAAIELPKWPGLLVHGPDIHPDQAAEIILRTESHYYFSGNDKAWIRALYRLAGVGADCAEGYSEESYETKRKLFEELGILDLQYIYNQNIISAWINGPHGWVDWAGRVGCRCYNIGKWPNAGEVLEDWKKIAAEWPFLELTSQLLSMEILEDGPQQVLAEYQIHHGQAKAVHPGPILKPTHLGRLRAQEFTVLSPGGERGCTIDQFTHALKLARATMERKRRAASTAP